jgi:hypothetical protein
MNVVALHLVNSLVCGHLLVLTAMALNAGVFFQRGGGLALLGILAAAVAIAAAHLGSGQTADGKPGLQTAYAVCALATALAWVFFILAASL